MVRLAKVDELGHQVSIDKYVGRADIHVDNFILFDKA